MKNIGKPQVLKQIVEGKIRLDKTISNSDCLSVGRSSA